MEIELTITPANLTSKGQLYVARVGSELICRAHSPFYSSARVLLAKGFPPDSVLVMRHEGSDTVSLRGTLGAAAKLTIVENSKTTPRIARYRPRPIEQFGETRLCA